MDSKKGEIARFLRMLGNALYCPLWRVTGKCRPFAYSRNGPPVAASQGPLAGEREELDEPRADAGNPEVERIPQMGTNAVYGPDNARKPLRIQ